MTYVLVKMGSGAFLLPDSHADNYEFPTDILAYREAIEAHLSALERFAKDPLTDHFSDLPDLSPLKRITGAIGVPFDVRDAELYAVEHRLDITMEVSL